MAMIFLLLSAAGWLRMYDSLSRWYWLNFSGVHPGPLYLAVTGAVWGIAGAVSFLWLSRGWPWSRLAGVGSVSVCLITYWADRLLFTRAPDANSNTGFALLVSFIGLASAVQMLQPADEYRRLVERWRSSRK